MSSWKARLLMLLTTMAMILAVSMPTMAQAQTDDGCIGVGSGPDDEDCIGILTGTGDSCDFNDSNLDGIDDNDFDLDGINDNCENLDSSGFDTISVGDVDCFIEDGDELVFCVDDNGDIVNV